MAISTEIVGKTFGPFVRDYTFKDLEICALGCGAGWDGRVDLEYVNEGDAKNPDLKVLPIFAVPLTVNEEMTTTLDYGFDYSGSLHYGIDVHFHAPFKMNDHIETFVTQEAIWDRGEGRGSLSKQVGKLYSADGTHLCTVDTYDCCIYDGGWGGEQPPRDSVEYPDRDPDFTYEETYGYNWPLVYRLMGDWHQQHIDWSYTEQTGLERPIAHGVSSAGVAMRHVISLLFLIKFLTFHWHNIKLLFCDRLLYIINLIHVIWTCHRHIRMIILNLCNKIIYSFLRSQGLAVMSDHNNLSGISKALHHMCRYFCGCFRIIRHYTGHDSLIITHRVKCYQRDSVHSRQIKLNFTGLGIYYCDCQCRRISVQLFIQNTDLLIHIV